MNYRILFRRLAQTCCSRRRVSSREAGTLSAAPPVSLSAITKRTPSSRLVISRQTSRRIFTFSLLASVSRRCLASGANSRQQLSIFQTRALRAFKRRDEKHLPPLLEGGFDLLDFGEISGGAAGSVAPALTIARPVSILRRRYFGMSQPDRFPMPFSWLHRQTRTAW